MSNFEAENFFKVYLSNHSFQRMLVPPTAIVCSNELMPATATLRNCKGKCWHVEVNTRNDGKMYFEKGWRRFVDENSIKDKDFLVFSYVRCTVFDVKVLQLNGCEKSVSDLVLEEQETKNVLVEEGERGEENEQEQKEEDDGDFLEEGEACEQELEEKEEDNDDDDYQEEGEESELELEEEEEENDDDDDYQEEGEDSELELEEEEENDNDICQEGKDSEMEWEEEEEEENEELLDILNKRSGKKMINKRKRGWHEEFAAKNDEGTTSMEFEDEDVNPEKYVQHLNPYFVARIRGKRTNELYVPLNVIKDFGLTLEEEITFIDPCQRKSTEKVVKWKDGRICIRGWRSFCHRNKVDHQRHACICEILLEKELEDEMGQKVKFIKVHIVHRRKSAKSQKPSMEQNQKKT
ncbi:hypothetical protein REPUB_Repub01dG0253700 [Reevesia pubescens]